MPPLRLSTVLGVRPSGNDESPQSCSSSAETSNIRRSGRLRQREQQPIRLSYHYRNRYVPVITDVQLFPNGTVGQALPSEEHERRLLWVDRDGVPHWEKPGRPSKRRRTDHNSQAEPGHSDEEYADEDEDEAEDEEEDEEDDDFVDPYAKEGDEFVYLGGVAPRKVLHDADASDDELIELSSDEEPSSDEEDGEPVDNEAGHKQSDTKLSLSRDPEFQPDADEIACIEEEDALLDEEHLKTAADSAEEEDDLDDEEDDLDDEDDYAEEDEEDDVDDDLDYELQEDADEDWASDVEVIIDTLKARPALTAFDPNTPVRPLTFPPLTFPPALPNLPSTGVSIPSLHNYMRGVSTVGLPHACWPEPKEDLGFDG